MTNSINDSLEPLRNEIANIDNEIITLLIQRFELTNKVGFIKKQNKVPILNKDVETQILDRLINRAGKNIDAELIRKIYTEIFKESRRRQEKL